MMVSFCNNVIHEIKTAGDETELVRVIRRSMTRFRNERRSFNDEAYVMNMIVSLKSSEQQPLSANSLDNIKIAIAIFRQFQSEIPTRIF